MIVLIHRVVVLDWMPGSPSLPVAKEASNNTKTITASTASNKASRLGEMEGNE